VVLNCSLDYEVQSIYSLQLLASDNGAPPRSTTARLTIFVDNIIQTVPQFTRSVYTVQVNETWPLGKPFLTTFAGTFRREPNFSVEYFMACNCPLFVINSTTGQISLRDKLQFDIASSHVLFILAINTLADPPATSLATVVVRVLQINQFPPVFSTIKSAFTLLEDAPVNNILVTFAATDPDRPFQPTAITYRIEGNGNVDSSFFLDSVSGELRVARPLSFSLTPVYNLTISACDQALSPLCSTLDISIQLLRVNQLAPVFLNTPYVFSVLEHLPAGSRVNGSVIATDPDAFPGDRIVYSLRFPVAEFNLNASTGEITTSIMLDHFSAPQRSFQLLVVANDSAAYRPRIAQTLVIIDLINIIKPPPVFLPSIFNVTLAENLSNNTFVTTARASSTDPFDQLTYHIEDLDASNAMKFFISSDGTVTCDTLDFEQETSYALLIVVTNRHGDQISQLLNVTVQDLNDNEPQFDKQLYTFTVFENATANSSVGAVIATDIDSPPNALFLYSLISGYRSSGLTMNQFTIDPLTGVLSAMNLNFEDQELYNITVRAQNTAPPFLFSEATVLVSVLDVVDAAPVFIPVGVISLFENFTVGDTVVQLAALDAQPSRRSRLEFSLLCCQTQFAIDTLSGLITTIAPLDREVVDMFNLTISVTDVGDQSLTAFMTVPIQVLDIHDSPPMFTQLVYTVNISEDASGMALLQVQASSRDTAVFGTIDNYFFLDLQGSLVASNEWLSIDSAGLVTVLAPFNFEQQSLFTFAVVAVARGGLQGSALVMLNVAEVIYPPPIFADPSPTFIVVNELTLVGTIIYQFQGLTTDPDQALIYAMDRGDTSLFAFNATNGQLALASKLRFDAAPVHALTISVMDNPRVERKSELLAYVFVLDSYSELPLFDLVDLDPVQETAPPGTFVGRVRATHQRGPTFSNISYFVLSGDTQGAFALDAQTGVITVAGPLNWKLRKQYRMEILAVEGSFKRRQSVTNITIDVLDMNRNPPFFDVSVTSVSISEKLLRNSSVFIFTYSDSDNGINALSTFSLVDGDNYGCFDLDEVTGQLYLACTLDQDLEARYQLHVRVRNVAEPFFTDEMLFDVFVEDVYVAPPAFDRDVYFVSVSEATVLNTPLDISLLLTSNDGDAVVPGFQPSFALVDSFSSTFSIDPVFGVITLTSTLNWSAISSYQLQIVGSNALNTSEQALTSVLVTVLDVNDHDPFFVGTPSTIELPEDTPLGLLLTLAGEDIDMPDATRLTFALASPSPLVFVDGDTGDVFLFSALDFEINPGPISLAFSVCDNDFRPVSRCGYTTIVVRVLDVNDNSPKFAARAFSFTVPEDLAVAQAVGQLNALDVDSGVNGLLQFSLEQGQNGENLPFLIDAHGNLILASPLDFESTREFSFLASVSDGTFVDVATAQVTVTNVNDNLPVFVSVTDFHVSEKIDIGQRIGVLLATDADVQPVNYSIAANGFIAVEAATGVLSVMSRLDSAMGVLTFNAFAWDRTPAEYDQQGLAPTSVVITVTVLGNSRAPVFNQSLYTVNISEYTLPEPQSSLLTVAALDIDNPTYPIRFYLITNTSLFALQSDGTLRLSSSIALIRTSTIRLTVEAVNPLYPRLRSTARIVINIEHLNNYAPVFSAAYYTATVKGLKAPGEFVQVVRATDRDFGRAGQLGYEVSADNSQNHSVPDEILSSGYDPTTMPFTIDNEGRVFTTSQIGSLYGPSMYAVTIIATDRGSPSRSTAVVLYVFIEHDLTIDTPLFSAPSVEVHLGELTPLNTLCFKAVASTSNPESQASIGYFIAAASVANVFAVDLRSGDVTNNQPFNLAAYGSYVVVIAAFNVRKQELFSLQMVTFIINDENLHAPQILSTSPRTVFISEALSVGDAVTTVLASDADADRNGLLTFSLTLATDDAFTIDANTGVIRVAKRLQSHAHPGGYTCSVSVADRATRPLFNFTIVTVFVVNSQMGPLFSQPFYSANIPEDAVPGTQVTSVLAMDFFGDNRNITFQLTSCSVALLCPFAVDAFSGAVLVQSALDFESYAAVTLEVQALDDEANTNTVFVFIELLDANDNAPAFPASFISVDIMAGSGFQTLGVFSATDADAGRNAQLSYTIISTSPAEYASHFAYDPVFGLLVLVAPVNFQQVRSINVSLQATDAGTPPLSSSDATVFVNVVDNKDNRPVFDEHVFLGQIAENQPVGQQVTRVSAKVLDALGTALNIPIVYSLLQTFAFAIDATTGDITSTAVFDRESVNKYDFFVLAVDGTGFTAMASVRVTITDENDNSPAFLPSLPSVIEITENVLQSAVLATLTATDVDVGSNSRLSYSLVPSSESGSFAIDNATGALSIVAPLDAEVARQLVLTIAATDGGSPALTTLFSLTVIVRDVNDNAPQVVVGQNLFEIDESLPAGSSLLTLSFTDGDVGDNAVARFDIAAGNEAGFFSLSPTTGELTVVMLDYSVQHSFALKLRATNHLVSPTLFTEAWVYINLTDTTKPPPQFANASYFASVLENSSPALIVAVTAADVDPTPPAFPFRLEYAIVEKLSDSAFPFSINPTTGVVFTSGPLDRELTAAYQMTIEVTLYGYLPITSSTTLQVTVMDVNDNNPQIVPTDAVQIDELLAVGTVVYIAQAFDADEGKNSDLTFELKDGQPYFAIEPFSGVITLTSVVRFTTFESHQTSITVLCRDSGEPQRSNTSVVTVTFRDINDHAPEFTSSPLLDVLENVDVGTLLTVVMTTDKDETINSFVSVLIVSGNEDGVFQLDPGGALTLRKNLDREARDRYELNIVASNPQALFPQTAAQLLTISVLDVNDNAPVFDAFTADLSFTENISLGTEIAALRATDMDIGPNGLVRFALSVAGGSFTIDPWTGVVRVNGVLDAERQGAFNVSVTAYDEGSPMLSTTIVLNISLVPLNNRFPVFSGELVARVNLSESQPSNSVIFIANARGFDVAPVQAYAIVSGSQDHFAIHPVTGRVSLVRPLNWSVFSLYTMVISATNTGGLVSHMTLVVSVIDTNNNRPVFDSASYVANLNENELGQRPIVRVVATDADQGAAGTVGLRYSIDVGAASERFLIDPLTGWILAVAPFDFEAERNRVIVLRARATDSGTPQQTRAVFVFVTIMDVFDDWPIFTPRIYPAAVPETASVGTLVTTVAAFDWNRGLYGPIVYSLLSPLPGLEIDANSGVLSTTDLLAEQLLRKTFLIYVQAANSRGVDVAMVNITVIETLANVPFFAPAHYAPVIAEDTSMGSPVAHVKAFDQNLGDNGPISFFIADATMPGAFAINQITGELTVAATLDRETQPWHMLQVVATFGAETFGSSSSGSAPARLGRSLQRHSADVSRRETATPAACPPCSSARSSAECSSSCVWEPQLGFCREATCMDIVQRDDCQRQSRCVFDENSLLCLDNSTVLPCEGYSLESMCPQDRCTWEAALGYCAPRFDPPACTYRSVRNCNSGCAISVSSNLCVSNISCQAFPAAVCPFGCFVDLISQCQDLPPRPECYPTLTARLVTSTTTTTTTTTTSTTTTSTTTAALAVAVTTTTTTAPTTIPQATRSTTAPHTTPNNPPQFSSLTCSSCTWTYINVTLTDVNDNAPVLACPSRVVYHENTTVDTALFTCTASDADLALNGMVTFRLANHTPEFEIDRVTGQVSLVSGLDVLRAPTYTLVVIAEDHGSPSLQTSVTVVVDVMDVNNHPPRFDEAVYSWSVVENTEADFVVGRVRASDLDLGMNGEFSFAIINGSRGALAMLSLNASTGEIMLLAVPDRELISSYTLHVRCTDQGPTQLSSDAMVVINVLDVNDNYPTFSTPTYFAALLENQEHFMLVTHVQASDPDADNNGTMGILFQLSSQSDSRFALDPRTGDILVTQPVLYNQDRVITLTVIATDQLGTGDASLSTAVEVIVTILPRNLHRPIFSAPAYAATLDEFLVVGSSTGVVVNATDLDQGGGFGVVNYELHDTTGDFSINATTGEIFIHAALDWNRQSRYIVPVLAKDIDQRFDLVYVTFNITYNLLHPEPKFVQASYTTQISENAAVGTLLDVVPRAVDIVNGLNFPFRYFISQADTAWFSVEPNTGNITIAGLVDREVIFNGRTVSMTVTALYLPNGRSTTCTVVVSVLDENDNAPQFTLPSYSFSHLENLTVGSLIGTVSASDIDAGANMLVS
jgi:protocadherin Fat 4